MARSGWKSLVLPGIATVAALALLIALGNWQMRRLAWKEGLIARIEARIAAPPVGLADLDALTAHGGDVDYRPVRVSGRFLNDRESHLFAGGRLGVGWHVYTPLRTGLGTVVFVNRGFVPDALKDPADRAAGRIDAATTVVGLARAAPATRPNSDVPDNDVAGNVFYWRDLDAMAVRAGLDAETRIHPFFVDAGAGDAQSWPRGGTTRIALANRHLGYALTWYGLAVALLGVFAAFARTRLRT